MAVHVVVSDSIFDGEERETRKLSKDFEQAYIVWKYLNSEISIGRMQENLEKVADSLGIDLSCYESCSHGYEYIHT